MKNPQKGDIVLITGRRAKVMELGSRMTNNGLRYLVPHQVSGRNGVRYQLPEGRVYFSYPSYRSFQPLKECRRHAKFD